MTKIEIGDVVSPKGDPVFYMTVVKILSDSEVEVDFPDVKSGGRIRETFPVQALTIHEKFGEDEESGYQGGGFVV
ncbi:hypothetical protein N9850_11055 [Granulosicoccus sp.]|nr:hypothetical protein [Granulosicoccus sp.]MDB4224302.1 hypothetical protein [Granulosicoccus sp.]